MSGCASGHPNNKPEVRKSSFQHLLRARCLLELTANLVPLLSLYYTASARVVLNSQTDRTEVLITINDRYYVKDNSIEFLMRLS